MELLLVGVAGFVLGVVAIIAGRAMYAAEIRRSSGALAKVLEPFFEWFISVLRREWAILTGVRATTGERIAAAGSILAGISVLAMLGGIVSAVGTG